MPSGGPAASSRDVVALVPLGSVLLPGMPLPLRIFERRYRQLLADVSAAPGSASFGVVALTRGSEVESAGTEQAPEFAQVGTIAEVLELQSHEDGTSDLFTVGSRRFRILRMITGKPYLQAQVEYLPERDGRRAGELSRLVRRLEAEHARLITARTGAPVETARSREPNQFSYQVAAQIPLGPAERQILLETASAAERLTRTAALLRREITLLRATGTIAVAPHVLQLHVRSN